MLTSLINNRTFRQTSSLFGSGLFLTFMSIITTPIVTRTLGPVDYSIMKLFLTITNFAILFFDFGFPITAGLLLASCTSEDEQRKLIGASLIVSLLIGGGYALFLLQFSFYSDSLFGTVIGRYLRLVIPFLIFYPVNQLIHQVGKGTNRIDSIVFGRSIPYIIRVIIIVLLWATGTLTLVSLIYTETAVALMRVGILMGIFKPSFSGFSDTVKIIAKKNREAGFHIYLAGVTSQSTYQLDGIMIPMFADIVQLGYYVLSNVFSETMSSFSIALSSSKYREFSRSPGISRRIQVANYGILIIGALGTIILGKPIIRIVAGEGFDVPFALMLPAGILGFIHGGYQPYYQFITARGEGRWIRNIGFVTAVINVVGNLLFIPYWGAVGAAWASVISRGTGFIAYLYLYKLETGNHADKRGLKNKKRLSS